MTTSSISCTNPAQSFAAPPGSSVARPVVNADRPSRWETRRRSDAGSIGRMFSARPVVTIDCSSLARA
jgi:hypothetical protein